MTWIKQLFFLYQKALWYAGQTKAEYGKVGSWIPETLMIMTYLTVKGTDVKVWYIPIAYVSLLVLATLIGKFLVVIGVRKYNITLDNDQNAEIQEILDRVKKLEKR